MNIIIEKVHKRRELDQLRDLYVRVLDASPTVLPDAPARDMASEILVAKNPQKSGILGGLTLNRDHGAVDQLARRHGPERARQWANDYPLITQLAVKPEYRGQGVGTALLSRAVELAKYRSAKMVWGFAEAHGKRPSAPFYERNGFTLYDAETEIIDVGDVQYASSIAYEGQYFTLNLMAKQE